MTALAEKVAVPAENLTKTIAQFNDSAESGVDLAFDRAAASMEAFDKGKVYAIKLAPAVLNTQGGPERNENAEILSVNGDPIPHLYGAGELGGICTNRYQGGGNLAECLIFGKIAGENAAKQKENHQSAEVEKPLQSINDLVDGERIDNIKLGPDQYVGTTEAGIGGKIVVRVTYKDATIKNVEVLESHETEGIGAVAIKEIPSKFVEANTTDVDVSSGASSTNRALKEAVENAIKSANK
nr:FMN-binding protein [Lactiplantibacillus pentosus]